MPLKIAQDTLKMHKQAMYFAQDALLALNEGLYLQAFYLYYKAFELEREVYTVLVSNGDGNMESLGIIFRSAITLGLQARSYAEVRRLYKKGLHLNLSEGLKSELVKLEVQLSEAELALKMQEGAGGELTGRISNETMLISADSSFRLVLRNILRHTNLVVFDSSEAAIHFVEKRQIPGTIVINVDSSIATNRALNEMINLIEQNFLKGQVRLILLLSLVNNDPMLEKILHGWTTDIYYKPFDPDHLKEGVNRSVERFGKKPPALLKDFSSYDIYTRRVSLAKRLFDIVLSLSALIVLLPVFLLIIIAIKLESKGKILYVNKRAGWGFEVFSFYKFRTMISDADKKIQELTHLKQYTSATDKPIFFKINNDPRLTRVGIFLRRTYLDELPQLINVLFGQMSFVGNRPLPLYEAKTLLDDRWVKRFIAPAGLTGLWQVKKRGNANMSIEERMSLDVEYSDKQSLKYDLWILLQTPSSVMAGDNA